MGTLPCTHSGNKYILIVADYFSKWVEAFPMPNQEACTVAELLVKEVVCRFGVPLLIHSDQGRNFVEYSSSISDFSSHFDLEQYHG